MSKPLIIAVPRGRRFCLPVDNKPRFSNHPSVLPTMPTLEREYNIVTKQYHFRLGMAVLERLDSRGPSVVLARDFIKEMEQELDAATDPLEYCMKLTCYVKAMMEQGVDDEDDNEST